jgi:hypothetical protein
MARKSKKQNVVKPTNNQVQKQDIKPEQSEILNGEPTPEPINRTIDINLGKITPNQKKIKSEAISENGKMVKFIVKVDELVDGMKEYQTENKTKDAVAKYFEKNSPQAKVISVIETENASPFAKFVNTLN